MYTIIGLGNPGPEYAKSRHNAGRMAATFVAEKLSIELEADKKYLGVSGMGKLGDSEVQIILPDTFMNKSGSSAKKAVKSKDAAKKLVVIYDDIDIRVGSMKVSFNRGSGGHKGIESVENSLGTKEFIRIRIGIVPVNDKGVPKKPLGEENVQKHVMSSFTPREKEMMEKINQRVLETLLTLEKEGLDRAMTLGNRHE